MDTVDTLDTTIHMITFFLFTLSNFFDVKRKQGGVKDMAKKAVFMDPNFLSTFEINLVEGIDCITTQGVSICYYIDSMSSSMLIHHACQGNFPLMLCLSGEASAKFEARVDAP